MKDSPLAPQIATENLKEPLQPTTTNIPLVGTIKDLGKYQFSFEQKLGSGLTSDAYLGRNKQTQELVCVKIIDQLNFKTQKQKQLLENQIKCQQKLSSNYIVNLLDVFNTNSFTFIVTQLCQDGDLFKLIKFSRAGLPERLVVRFARQLATALAKLKEYQIVHRDIKSENILLKKGVAKLADFGFSIEEKNLKTKQDLSVGSPLYMPLEALEQKKYSYSSDIFSYGIVLYEMLHGRSPWQCSDQLQLIHRMKTEQVSFRNDISEMMKKLILMCLEKNQQKRAEISKIIEILKEFPEEKDIEIKANLQNEKK